MSRSTKKCPFENGRWGRDRQIWKKYAVRKSRHTEDIANGNAHKRVTSFQIAWHNDPTETKLQGNLDADDTRDEAMRKNDKKYAERRRHRALGK
jgi:hypothetical protein